MYSYLPRYVDPLGLYQYLNGTCRGREAAIDDAFKRIVLAIDRIKTSTRSPNDATEGQKRSASVQKGKLENSIRKIFAKQGRRVPDRFSTALRFIQILNELREEAAKGNGVGINCCPRKTKFVIDSCSKPWNAEAAAARVGSVI